MVGSDASLSSAVRLKPTVTICVSCALIAFETDSVLLGVPPTFCRPSLKRMINGASRSLLSSIRSCACASSRPHDTQESEFGGGLPRLSMAA